MKTSSIILAGGKSLRLGYDKVLETVGSRSLVEKVVNSVATLSDDIIIVTASERNMPEFDNYPGLKVVHDMYPGKGPLNGIYTGLHVSSTQCNIVVAADMP
ncbi:MAG TPA: NTP transferase domain-containing protein, partial [Dehalococcoidia bacterium]|nr:NTP transferase domain-containing protein [Dehalococcoidia bacterium]